MKPEVSIVVEWENVILAENSREDLMLHKLAQQILFLDKAVEVIVLFNPDQINGDELKTKLNKKFETKNENGSCLLKVVETQGNHYFDLKNEGGKLARGEIVVFIDSDVIPEDGWLIAMVQPFYDNPQVKVVAGSSYIEPTNLYSKAFALGWFFPLRTSKVSLHDQRNKLWGNNVAFRREIFTQFPFPKMPDGATRGSGILLAEQLRNEGIIIWTNTGARVSHPAPNGFSHFYKRAMAQGRDHCSRNYKTLNSRFSELVFTYYRKKIRKVIKRIILYHRAVALPVWQTPFALLIMLSYYTLALVGGFITLSMPQYAKASWRI